MIYHKRDITFHINQLMDSYIHYKDPHVQMEDDKAYDQAGAMDP